MRLDAIIDFLRRRIDKRSFTGLPLTLLLPAFLFLLARFFDLTEDVADSTSLLLADRLAERVMAWLRTPGLLWAVYLFTQAGDWRIVLPLAVAASFLLPLRGKRHLVLPLWAALLGSLVLNWTAKHALGRPRPLGAYYLESSYAYPSGHSAVAVAFYGFLAYALWRSATRRRARGAIVLGGATLVVLIGLSRLYLGVHYLSDVAGGFLQGGVCLIIGIGLAEWLAFRKGPSGV